MTEKLKPCPFCGAPGYLMLAAYGFKIKCTDTDCTVETPIKTHKHQVESLWNRRASPDMEQRAGWMPTIEALEGGKTDLGASGALGASGERGSHA